LYKATDFFLIKRTKPHHASSLKQGHIQRNIKRQQKHWCNRIWFINCVT